MYNGLWRSLVARCVRDAEAAGSNPANPTIVCIARRRPAPGLGLDDETYPLGVL